jgi:putative transcriptional regulator
MNSSYNRWIIGALLLASAWTARAQDFGTPMLLFAAPATQGAYSGTVLIAIPSAGGHVGVILNRSRDLKLASILPDSPQAAKVASPVAYGGPLGTRVLFAMVRQDPGHGAKRLLNDVYMTTGTDALNRIIDQNPAEARFFTGMRIWLPGELDAQIDAGEWIVTHPDSSMVFHNSPDTMWGELAARVSEPKTAPALASR